MYLYMDINVSTGMKYGQYFTPTLEFGVWAVAVMRLRRSCQETARVSYLDGLYVDVVIYLQVGNFF